MRMSYKNNMDLWGQGTEERAKWYWHEYVNGKTVGYIEDIIRNDFRHMWE